MSVGQAAAFEALRVDRFRVARGVDLCDGVVGTPMDVIRPEVFQNT